MQAWGWQFTPIPFLVFWSNLVWYISDGFTETSEDTVGTFPGMYSGPFAESIMSLRNGPLWGPFVWYDMFSWTGYFNWVVDTMFIDLLPGLVLIFGFVRNDKNDWAWETIEKNNLVDMNRIGTPLDQLDPYDRIYWTNLFNGKDCNGYVGVGKYCYCPS